MIILSCIPIKIRYIHSNTHTYGPAIISIVFSHDVNTTHYDILKTGFDTLQVPAEGWKPGDAVLEPTRADSRKAQERLLEQVESFKAAPAAAVGESVAMDLSK